MRRLYRQKQATSGITQRPKIFNRNVNIWRSAKNKTPKFAEFKVEFYKIMATGHNEIIFPESEP